MTMTRYAPGTYRVKAVRISLRTRKMDSAKSTTVTITKPTSRKDLIRLADRRMGWLAGAHNCTSQYGIHKA